MTIQLGVVMDPIQTINIKKDSTFAMLLAAQAQHWRLHYMEPKDLFSRDGKAMANSRLLKVKENSSHWYELENAKVLALENLDIILMRKDPPFNIEYIYITYLLEQAEKAGALVINKPQSLRDCNEKVFATAFPQCMPPTLITQDKILLKHFLQEHRQVIFKPLAGMGGTSVFYVTEADANINVIIDTLTQQGALYIMAQRYIPEIKQGDKRILLIDGEPVPFALARIPAKGETRGNLAAGGRGVGQPLTRRDQWICQQLGPSLKAKGLVFVGIDVIGDYLTEVNVTSPTCIRELDQAYGLNIAKQLMDCIEKKLKKR